ncbi:polymorphic PE/PPE family protein [Mycobacterium kansasii 732]|nr:polymorphic PE/PPE family protein [Mycobacterium kansasii 732]
MTLASTLSHLSAPPAELVGATAAQPWFPPVTPPIIDPLGPLFNTVSDVFSDLPASSLLSMAELGMYPASFMMSPLMMAMSNARGATAGLGAAGLGNAATAAASSAAPVVGGIAARAMTGLGGAAIPGAAMSATLGQAHGVGAVSVPPTWPGSVPSGLSSSAVQGLGSTPTPAPMTQPTPPADGVPMMPMAPRAAGSAAATPSEVTTRGGVGVAAAALAIPHSVIPRAGIG